MPADARAIALAALDTLLAELARQQVLLPAPLHLTAQDSNAEASLSLFSRRPLTDLPENLTGLQRDILEALGGSVMTAREIAAAAGYRVNSHFKSVLAALRRKGLLDHDGRGYHRPPRHD